MLTIAIFLISIIGFVWVMASSGELSSLREAARQGHPQRLRRFIWALVCLLVGLLVSIVGNSTQTKELSLIGLLLLADAYVLAISAYLPEGGLARQPRTPQQRRFGLALLVALTVLLVVALTPVLMFAPQPTNVWPILSILAVWGLSLCILILALQE